VEESYIARAAVEHGGGPAALQSLGITAASLKTHHDPGRRNILNFPNFNLTLESAYFYYDYANGELQALGFQENPKDIRRYAMDFANQSKVIAAAAMEATKSISEKVY
jgi:hypothetical protein